jgi:acyl carrier protein
MSSESVIWSGLDEIFRDVFLRDDLILTPALTAKEVEGWDSFKQIEIIIGCEERFGIKFTTRELDSLTSLGDLARVIAGKIPP